MKKSPIFIMTFYCEAYEFCEGQCATQCATCRQDDIDEEVMRELADADLDVCDGDKDE